MKKVFVLLMICLLPAMAMAQWGGIKIPNTPKKAIQKKTAKNDGKIRTEDAFMKALGSNKRLVIAQNTTLTFQNGIVLDGVHDLSIIGESNAKIQIKSREDVVLQLKNCYEVRLENLSLGHEEGVKPYYCGIWANVIDLMDCHHIYIRQCDLWGCGWIGLSASDSYNVECNMCVIRDCSDEFLRLIQCTSFKFANCDFIRNGLRGYGNSCIYNSQNILFKECRFAENLAKYPLFNISRSTGQISHSEIHHKGSFWFRKDDTLEDDMCNWYHDFESLPPRF